MISLRYIQTYMYTIWPAWKQIENFPGETRCWHYSWRRLTDPNRLRREKWFTVTFGITIHMSHISSWHGNKKGVVWCVQMGSNGSVRFGLAEHVCTGGIQNRTKNMTTDGQHCMFVAVSLFLFFAAIDRNFIWSLMIIVSFGFCLSSDEIGGLCV